MQRQARFTPGGPRTRQDTKTTKDQGSLERLGGYSEGQSTRSHSELGRENPQRPWYCVLRRGRVGRRQVFQVNLNVPSHDTPIHMTPRTRGGAAR